MNSLLKENIYAYLSAKLSRKGHMLSMPHNSMNTHFLSVDIRDFPLVTHCFDYCLG